MQDKLEKLLAMEVDEIQEQIKKEEIEAGIRQEPPKVEGSKLDSILGKLLGK